MYKLYYKLDTPEVLNIATVNYSRHIHTQRYSHGGRSWLEPAGSSWSDLRLEGPCDLLAGSLFFRLRETYNSNSDFFSTFYIMDNESDFSIKVSGVYIKDWRYTDSEDSSGDTYSFTLGVTDIQRLPSKKIEKKTQKKPKEKKIIIPERQIVICRIA